MLISSIRGVPSGAMAFSADTPQTPAEHPERTAGECEQYAFRQQLPHDAQPIGAKRAAYSDLAQPSRRAGEQQIRDVHAGDEQHESYCAEQHEQGEAACCRPAVPGAEPG